MHVDVYLPKKVEETEDLWEQIAGYDQVKKDIKDTIILSIKYPEKYREIARKTRKKYTLDNRTFLVIRALFHAQSYLKVHLVQERHRLLV